MGHPLADCRFKKVATRLAVGTIGRSGQLRLKRRATSLVRDAWISTASQKRLDVPIPAEIGGVHQCRTPRGILRVDVCAVLSKEGNHPAVRLHEDGEPKGATARIVGGIDIAASR